MPRIKEPGHRARAAILAELLRRDRAHEPSPSRRELDEAIGIASGRHHVETLREDGLVAQDAGVPRSLRLTRAGRAAAVLIESARER